MFVAEVPQVDGQLTQLVVPQVAVSQENAEQREGHGALTAHVLLRGENKKDTLKQFRLPGWLYGCSTCNCSTCATDGTQAPPSGRWWNMTQYWRQVKLQL